MKTFAYLALIAVISAKHHHKKTIKKHLVQFAEGNSGFEDLDSDIKMKNLPQHYAQVAAKPDSHHTWAETQNVANEVKNSFAQQYPDPSRDDDLTIWKSTMGYGYAQKGDVGKKEIERDVRDESHRHGDALPSWRSDSPSDPTNVAPLKSLAQQKNIHDEMIDGNVHRFAADLVEPTMHSDDNYYINPLLSKQSWAQTNSWDVKESHINKDVQDFSNPNTEVLPA